MNERDRLVELIRDIVVHYFAEEIADHLIANNIALPPVSVGQNIYLIRRPTEQPPWVAECKVEYVSVEYLENGKKVVFSSYNFSATDRDIGNKVFFTREEAERALEKGSECE